MSQGFDGWVEEVSHRTTASHYLYGIAQGNSAFRSNTEARRAEEEVRRKADEKAMIAELSAAVTTSAISAATEALHAEHVRAQQEAAHGRLDALRRAVLRVQRDAQHAQRR